MTQKKILILLAFSICLNVGFLSTTLVSHRIADPHGGHRYARHIELLRGLNLEEATFNDAKKHLDAFMKKRGELIAKKLELKLETLAMLEKEPMLPREVLESRRLKERQLEEALSTLGIDHSLDMRKVLPPDKMTLLYINAGKLIRAHRDRIVQLKDMTD